MSKHPSLGCCYLFVLKKVFFSPETLVPNSLWTREVLPSTKMVPPLRAEFRLCDSAQGGTGGPGHSAHFFGV